MSELTEIYVPSNYSKEEQEMMQLFILQRDDAKLYFTQIIKPRLDRAYKLYIADTTDRAKEIKQWQSNIVVPYIHSVIETLKPRILDARPDFTVQGRTKEDQGKSKKIQQLSDYTWEIAGCDRTSELVTSSALIYGMGYLQAYWKKDKRQQQFLSTKDLTTKKYKWNKKNKIFYDAPYAEWVDNYTLWYDWHNQDAVNKQYWFKRLLLPDDVIRRKYSYVDKKRLEIALASTDKDITDYGAIRQQVKLAHEKITKGSDYLVSGPNIFGTQQDTQTKTKLNEVFEWVRPYDDRVAIIINTVPVLKGGSMPFPYDFKETPFIGIPYLQLPGEYEGYGLPLILENPQIMLNSIKNQRIDAMTLNIHKMWIVNPLANVNKEDLVVRPFGIIYSIDPSGVKEVSTSDIKPSAYKEEELLKGDMRYSSGVDDFSMGVGSSGRQSATEVRHLRESTLERVRLFVNHLGDGYAQLLRYWISMWRQFLTKKLGIRITGEDGETEFPFIEPDDLKGEYDFKATVIPAIAGQNDVKRKQDMDLYQLLVGLPFIDPEKLTAKMLHDWSWNIKSIKKEEEPGQMPIEVMGGEMLSSPERSGRVSDNIAKEVMDLLGSNNQSFTGQGAKKSLFAEMGAPVNLLKTQGMIPPTPMGVKPTTNPRGLNRKMGGKVSTNIPLRETANPEGSLMNRVNDINK